MHGSRIAALFHAAMIRGVSETIRRQAADLRLSGTSDEGIAAMQGGELMQELEALGARDAHRGRMVERGLSPEQIAAYMGKQTQSGRERSAHDGGLSLSVMFLPPTRMDPARDFSRAAIVHTLNG